MAVMLSIIVLALALLLPPAVAQPVPALGPASAVAAQGSLIGSGVGAGAAAGAGGPPVNVATPASLLFNVISSATNTPFGTFHMIQFSARLSIERNGVVRARAVKELWS